MYKTLVKAKSIASSPGFPDYIVSQIQSIAQSRDEAYVNVTARLFNSNPVKTALAETLVNIRRSLGLENTERSRKKRVRAADFESDIPKSKARQVSSTTTPSDDNEKSDWEGINTSDELDEQPMSVISEEDGIIYSDYRTRLAGSSSDDASELEKAMPAARAKIEPDQYDPMEDKGISIPSSEPSSSYSPHHDKTETTKSPSTNPKSTTFLPSLMMGGYWFGTESDFDDDDDDDDGTAVNIEPRKNRKGQQARRQIWEKKFGQKANHVKSQSRDQGWDPRNGAQGGDNRGRRGRGRGGIRVRSRLKESADMSRGSGPNSEPVKPRAIVKIKQPDGPLHPSWLAAKKAKEQKQTATFTGKKTVFG